MPPVGIRLITGIVEIFQLLYFFFWRRKKGLITSSKIMLCLFLAVLGIYESSKFDINFLLQILDTLFHPSFAELT